MTLSRTGNGDLSQRVIESYDEHTGARIDTDIPGQDFMDHGRVSFRSFRRWLLRQPIVVPARGAAAGDRLLPSASQLAARGSAPVEQPNSPVRDLLLPGNKSFIFIIFSSLRSDPPVAAAIGSDPWNMYLGHHRRSSLVHLQINGSSPTTAQQLDCRYD
jgi:hypothetical protein